MKMRMRFKASGADRSVDGGRCRDDKDDERIEIERQSRTSQVHVGRLFYPAQFSPRTTH